MFVRCAKNDAYRNGNFAYIKRLYNASCPVALLGRYIKIHAGEGIDLNSNLVLLRKVTFSSLGMIISFLGRGSFILDVANCFKIAQEI